MKICFIPIDNRPVCYNLAKDIASIDKNIELFIPPREFLGDLKKNAGVNEILEWLENLPACDAIVLSLDTIAYGGLIPSRRGVNDKGIVENYEDIKQRLEHLKPLLKGKKVYAFSSIMRISNNNYNEEEKEYWKEWGKKIFEYSFSGFNDGIPPEILEDYLKTRRRNFEINKLYLEWQKEGIFDTLIFSKDDCAPKGFNVEEAHELERLGGKTKTGADEIPLTLLARAVEKEIKVVGVLKGDTSKGYETMYGMIMNLEDLIKLEKEYMKANDIKDPNRGKERSYSQAAVKVNSIEDVEAVTKRIEDQGYQTYSMSSIRNEMKKQTQVIQLILGGLGSISLLVSAIGIANTMTMAIYERTKEIGIMKVLGCELKDIKNMFLAEAAGIGFMGGIVGIVICYGLSALMNTLGASLMGSLTGRVKVSIIPAWLAAFGMGFSTFIGILSGYVPALRAVKITALSAIRHD